MLRFRSTLLVLVGVCVNSLDAFGESRSYEDRLTFRVYSPSVQQQLNNKTALLELRTQINKLHDAEFLKELALSNDNFGEQGSGLFADINNVSYTCREHWNRTIAGLLRSEFWAFKSKLIDWEKRPLHMARSYFAVCTHLIHLMYFKHLYNGYETQRCLNNIELMI